MTFAKVKASSAARGYGAEHRAARAAALAELAAAGVGRCCIGGEPIYPGQPLDLDHAPDRSYYRGLACRAHNRSDGASRGNYRRKGCVAPPVVTARDL